MMVRTFWCGRTDEISVPTAYGRARSRLARTRRTISRGQEPSDDELSTSVEALLESGLATPRTRPGRPHWSTEMRRKDRRGPYADNRDAQRPMPARMGN